MRYKHFSKNERNELSVLLKKGYSVREIASVLKRSPSSVSRELKRNTTKGPYCSRKANQNAYIRRYRAKRQCMKIRNNLWLEDYIKEKLPLGWTPEEIAGRLKLENGNKTVISCKSIYNWLGTVWGEGYVKYLPYRKPYRRKKKKSGKREIIKGRVFIEERPAVVNQRKRVGDFEGDTLGTPKSSKESIAGAVDRKSLYLLGKKIARLKEAMDAFSEMFKPYNLLTLTLDSGPENARFKELSIPTFFCHPYSAWEKPIIENTFQRLRKYIPKKASLTNYSQEEISAIIDKMNNTPRKRLGYLTPKEVFFQEQPLRLKVFNLVECCTSG